MTSQGSARTRFRRALASGDPLIAKAALGELPSVDLADALAVLLVHRGHWDFDRVAVRLHAKLSRELRLSMVEAQLALSSLQALDHAAAHVGAQTLASLFDRHGVSDAADVLEPLLDDRS